MCFLHVLKSMSEGKLSSLRQLLLFQLYLIVLKNPKEVSTVSISVSFRCSVHILEQGIIFWPDGLLHFSRVRHLIENNQLLHALQKNTWQLSFLNFLYPLSISQSVPPSVQIHGKEIHCKVMLLSPIQDFRLLSTCLSWEDKSMQLLGFMQFMSIQLFVVCKPSCCLLLKSLTVLLF